MVHRLHVLVVAAGVVLLLLAAPAATDDAAAAAVVAPAAAAPQPRVDPNTIKRVVVVSMNHLDVGFDGIDPTLGYAVNVINRYFDVYFPRAIAVASALREMNASARLVYTTHPWLVSVFLDCEASGVPQRLPHIGVPLHCPNASARTAFVAAVARGDIAWHAFPFNAQPELADASLFDAGVALAHRLDALFGHAPTATMSQRDVPGLTRGAVPLLAAAGVRALSVGVNSGSAPPGVPRAFVWRDAASGSSILAMWHPGGYGGTSVSDCVLVDGLDWALAPAFRGDNAGPPEDAAEVLSTFAVLQREFPNAAVVAGTFDEFVHRLETVADRLPVVDAEIGDTWIYGVASDPAKTAHFREILRLRAACVRERRCDPAATEFARFDRLLLKVFEHTWGGDVKKMLHDWSNWSNEQFENARAHGTNYLDIEASWKEQRAYITNALVLLKHADERLYHEVVRALEAMVPHLPDPAHEGYRRVSHNATFSCGRFDLRWGGDGALHYLFDRKTGIAWLGGGGGAGGAHALGLYQYETYDAAAVEQFLDEYLLCPPSRCLWERKDFGKLNVSEAHPERQILTPTLSALWLRKEGVDACSFLARVLLPADAVLRYGAPQETWIRVDTEDATVDFTLQWFNKTATRLPEAHFFRFIPNPRPGWRWSMDKLGSQVDPQHVVVNGSFHLHAVGDGGLTYSNGTHAAVFTSLDAPLTVLGKPTAYPTPLAPADFDLGVSFVLADTLWGTNYVMWYPFDSADRNSLFRFSISFPF